MAAGELQQKEIAERIKTTEQTICNWKKDPDFMNEYEKLVKISIQSIAARAFKTQTNLLNAKSEMVRYMTAKDILDRAGYKPVEKMDVNVSETEKLDSIISQIGGEGLEE